jgi:hypothetical protein
MSFSVMAVVLLLGSTAGQTGVATPPQATAASQALTPPISTTLEGYHAALSRVPPSSDSIGAVLRRATAALTALRNLSSRWPADSPEDYRRNLFRNLRWLEAAIDKGDPNVLESTLEAAAEDLEVKLEHCTKSGGRLGGSVIVRVRTVHGDAEAKSWQVFYLPKILELSDSATPDMFPQLSSPTEETLVPGRYVMWVRQPGTTKTGDRVVVRVGEGRKELLLDLPVPQSFAP